MVVKFGAFKTKLFEICWDESNGNKLFLHNNFSFQLYMNLYSYITHTIRQGLIYLYIYKYI